MNELREIRKLRGRTQAEVADALGVKLQSYSQMERRFPLVRLDNLQSVCAFLGVDVLVRADGGLQFREPEPGVGPEGFEEQKIEE